MLSGTLTVQENIALSAALRLPSDISRGERKEKVDEIMEELNLTHVANQKVKCIDASCLQCGWTEWLRWVLNLFEGFLEGRKNEPASPWR